MKPVQDGLLLPLLARERQVQEEDDVLTRMPDVETEADSKGSDCLVALGHLRETAACVETWSVGAGRRQSVTGPCR